MLLVLHELLVLLVLLVLGTENCKDLQNSHWSPGLINKRHDFPVWTVFHVPIHRCDELLQVRLVKTFALPGR